MWTIMVAAKLDHSRVLVTTVHQNPSTLKGRSAGQRHTDKQTNSAEKKQWPFRFAIGPAKKDQYGINTKPIQLIVLSPAIAHRLYSAPQHFHDSVTIINSSVIIMIITCTFGDGSFIIMAASVCCAATLAPPITTEAPPTGPVIRSKLSGTNDGQ